MKFLKQLLEIDVNKNPMSKGLVICGFPGIGKSTFVENNKSVLDSDSSTFDKKKFPDNYISRIKEVVSDGKVILASSHDVVRNALIGEKIPFVLVYPDVLLKAEYIKRYEERGSPESFVKLLSANFEKWVVECESLENEFVKKIKLNKKQFLSDVVDQLVTFHIENSLDMTEVVDNESMNKTMVPVSMLLTEYKKSAVIKARNAKSGEVVVTITGGETETVNTAKSEDVLIVGVDGEKYLIPIKKFKSRYTNLDGSIIKDASDKLVEYMSTGVAYCAQWSGDKFKFIASWGEEMICNSGDYLATTSLEDIEIYRIAGDIFSTTYK